MKSFKFLAITAASLMLFWGSFNSQVLACNAPENDELCDAVSHMATLAATNFSDITGDLDDAQTEMEGEDVFVATEILPGFESGYIVPTFTEGKKKIQFWASYDDMDAANAGLNEIESDLKTCLTVANGYKNREDSGIHFFTSNKVNIELMTKQDYDDEGNDTYMVLVQIYKH